MPSTTANPRLTERDLEILLALDRCPLSVEQLLKLSQTFVPPFRTARRLRERMHALVRSDRVYRWQYLTAGRGAPNYYTLSRLGYRILHGPKAILPSAATFGPVAIARQHHTQALADFIVHTAVAAHQAGIAFTGYYRENSLRLPVGEEALFPDCAFQLVPPGSLPYSFFIELDNATERVRSPKDLDSWERKITLYEAFQDQSPRRFRVLIISTARGDRLQHILALARERARNPKRSLFYGISLTEYLAASEAITSACFLNHWGRRCAMVPQDGKSLRAVTTTAARAALVSPSGFW